MTAKLGRDYFEGLYAESADPWDFATSEYERAKYNDTMAFLGDRRYGRGLELGCSIGVLTERLAARCDELLAVDVARRAVAAARERLAGRENVAVAERDLPGELPPGPWDLVMASEVLYYWDADVLSGALDALARELAPDGRLVAVHWTEPTETYPLQGDEVHAILRAHPGLRLVDEARRDRYRVDVLTPGP